jgi:hypothetical protein
MVGAMTAPVLLAAQTQTRVSTAMPSTQRGLDSLRIIRFDSVSPATVRAMKLAITQLIQRNGELERRLLGAPRNTSEDLAKYEMLSDELHRAGAEVMLRQRELAISCAALRPQVPIDGTFGFSIDSKIVTEQSGPNLEELTFEFERAPTITTVEAGSPAEKSGIRVGDVWMTVNGKRLMGRVRIDELLKPGSVVSMSMNRGGQLLEFRHVPVAKRVSNYPSDACETASQFGYFGAPFQVFGGDVRPETRKQTPPRPAIVLPAPLRQLFVYTIRGLPAYGGAVLRALDEETRETLKQPPASGVIVVQVQPGLPAEAWGLRTNDVITHVNGELVTTPEVLLRLVDSQRVTLTVSRAGVVRSVVLNRR